MKRFLKVLVKIVLTILALYIVFQKIDVQETLKVFNRINPFWMVLAFLLFNFSKIISAFRFITFFKQIGIYLNSKAGIKLTYIGMFYNLFLPGGIGGDGFKVYLLKKNNKGERLKKIVTGALLDRISGLIALVFLCLPVLTQTSTYFLLNDPRINFYLFAIMVLYYPVTILLNRAIFKSFRKAFILTDVQSIAVQAFQLLSAYCILLSLGINKFQFDYLELFLISSIATVLPLTIGGIGIRELVFVYGFKYLIVDKHLAIGFTLSFFLITVISSFIGVFLNVTNDLSNETKNSEVH